MKLPFVLIKRSVLDGYRTQVDTYHKQAIQMMVTVEKLTDANIELYTKYIAAEEAKMLYKREANGSDTERRRLAKELREMKARIAEMEQK